MPPSIQYRGRFAPSPTGPLHFGSLAAAVGSYLDARHHNGTWLVRMEDLDTPRCVPGASDDILRTLEAFGLHWDGEIIFQSRRSAAYEAALQRLKEVGALYPCCCTRKEIADSAQHGIDGMVYPGTCRNGIPEGREGRAWRVRTDVDLSHHSRLRGNDETQVISGSIEFDDALQGHITQHLESEIGDFVVKRADGLFAYQLAVVVDDAFQGITHVVRGADLLHSTTRQIHLQRLLGFSMPHYSDSILKVKQGGNERTTKTVQVARPGVSEEANAVSPIKWDWNYMHLPIAVNAQGEKLSKQTLAPAIAANDTVATLLAVLEFLRQQPPAELRQGRVEEILNWAVGGWQPERLMGCRQIPVSRS